MKTQADYIRDRRELAEMLKKWNNQACIHIAKILRTWDEFKRLSLEAGQKPEELIPVAYFEAVYKILSYAPELQRMTVMAGTSDQIEMLISEVQNARGFYDEGGVWMEL